MTFPAADVDQATGLFITYCKAKGLAPRTLETYSASLKGLGEGKERHVSWAPCGSEPFASGLKSEGPIATAKPSPPLGRVRDSTTETWRGSSSGLLSRRVNVAIPHLHYCNNRFYMLVG
jgi:hypothetical protein